MWALWLKFNPEPIYCIQPLVISIKPFCLSARTASGRQERLMLPPGRALAQPSAEQWGVVGRIQNGLNSGYWKRHYGYTVLGFWPPQLLPFQGSVWYRVGKCSPKKQSCGYLPDCWTMVWSHTAAPCINETLAHDKVPAVFGSCWCLLGHQMCCCRWVWSHCWAWTCR